MLPADFVEQWYEDLRREDLSSGTINGYIGDVRRFSRWFEERGEGTCTPERITPSDLRDYRNSAISSGRSPATVNRTLAAVTRWLVWCTARGLITDVPRVRNVPVVDVGIVAPSRPDVARLTREAERAGPRDAAIVWMLRGTGARVSELAGTILMDIEMTERKGQWTIRGKGGKVRQLPLNASARSALRRYLDVRPSVGHSALFVGRGGEPLGARGIRRVIDGLSGGSLTPHSIRRYAATQMLREGGSDIVTVAAALGHSSIQTTARYAVARAEDVARALGGLSEED
jgi:site-specific recombinase XerD